MMSLLCGIIVKRHRREVRLYLYIYIYKCNPHLEFEFPGQPTFYSIPREVRRRMTAVLPLAWHTAAQHNVTQEHH